MESLDKASALRLITLFSGAIKGMAFYPASHPAIKQPLVELHTLFDQAFDNAEQVSIGLIDGLLFFDDHLFITPSAAASDMTNRLLEKDISRIQIIERPLPDELELLLKLFAQKGARCEALSRQLAESDISSIQLIAKGAESFETKEETGDDESGGNHVETYNRALAAIRTICRDIERGRIPGSAPLIAVVDRMASITMQEPWALLGLTMIKDYDNYTFNHCVNVGILAMALGASLGMDEQSVRDLGIAGQLHDIGKTMISKTILNKPGKLSSEEFEEMKRHPELGSKIIREMDGLAAHISSVVLGHHLHFNRSGYPEWASKLPFNQMVDIIAAADTYDAITTLRVYQHPVNPKTALNEMQKLTDTMLDGTIVERFVEMMGAYPVGTLVRLDTNEVAIVNRPNPLDANAPMVRILIDSDGNRLRSPREQMLAEYDGVCYAKIVAVVDPLLKNIDISRLIASGNY
jgi:HD-GYP domain-containing protein (c-di-GMP phosphodiesterase class II)